MLLTLVSLFAASSALVSPARADATGEEIANLAKDIKERPGNQNVCFKKTFKFDGEDTLLPGKSSKYKCYVRRANNGITSIGPCKDPTYLPPTTENAEMEADTRNKVKAALPEKIQKKIEAARSKKIEAARASAERSAQIAQAKLETDRASQHKPALSAKALARERYDTVAVAANEAVQAASLEFDSTLDPKDYGFKPRDYSKESPFDDFKFGGFPGRSFPDFKETMVTQMTRAEIENCKKRPKPNACVDATIVPAVPPRKIQGAELADYLQNKFSTQWQWVKFVKRPLPTDTEATIVGIPEYGYHPVQINREILPLNGSHTVSAFICYGKPKKNGKGTFNVAEMKIDDFVAATGNLLRLGARPEPETSAKPEMQDHRPGKKSDSGVQAQ
jgi:hypothetical protein